VARSRQRHPFVGVVRIRARELLRRPLVVALFLLQAAAVAVLEGMRFVDVYAGATEDSLVLDSLRLVVAPGGLLFGVLAATVVGAEFNWATERALLARDPRRPRFVAMQLAIVTALMVAWIVAQVAFAVGAGTVLRLLIEPPAVEFQDPDALVLAVAAAVAATVFYGLFGAACALAFRGGLAGVFGVLSYGLLVELLLGSRWRAAAQFTVRSAATSLAGQGGLPVLQAVAVLAVSALVALVGAFLVYSGREVRE
jgi:hypothetical protein